jgi:nucleoside 2-deoxyribosyltransferase
MKPTIYLAGPIANLTYVRTTGWRMAATKWLSEEFTVLDPMRGKHSTDWRDYDPKLTVARDLADIRRADALIIGWPKEIDSSLGTSMEMGVALERNIPTFFVSFDDPDPDPVWHPFLRAAVTKFCPTLEEACLEVRTFFAI